MKPVVLGPLAVAGAALLFTYFPGAPAPAVGGPNSEPGDANAWADEAEAELWSELEARGPAVRERSLRKTEVALAVLHGGLSLDQAAALFREANAGAADRYGPLAAMYPGATEEELSCRQVVRFVRGFALNDPGRVAAVLPALEAEVARRFPRPACGGDVAHTAG